MYALHVTFTLRPGEVPIFDALTRDLITDMKSFEPGTVVYLPLCAAGVPDKRVFFEVYESYAAFEAHERFAHTVTFLSERASCLAEPPAVERLKSLDVGAILRAS